MCFHYLGSDLDNFFILVHPKDTPQSYWLVTDNALKSILFVGKPECENTYSKK